MAKGKASLRVAGDVGLGLFGLLLGAAVFVLFQSTTGGASDGAPEPALVFEIPSAGSGAASPEDAVRLFLDAEADGNVDEAFDLLSDADRGANVSAQLWASRRPIGRLDSWEWISIETLETTVAREPGLSLTRGWSAASNTVTWSAVEEDGWRVSLAGSVAVPDLPDPSAAVAAADAWLGDVSRCAHPDDQRLVIATPSSAFDRLCVNGGVLAGATSSPVAGRVAAELQGAYGPGSDTWARSVPLEGGDALTLVAIGDEWVVIDATSS